MGKKDFKGFRSPPTQVPAKGGAPPGKRFVSSLLDVMQDGNEYGSLIDVLPQNTNVRDEVRRAIGDVEAIRQRPMLVYAANVLKAQVDTPVGIVLADDLAFSEMVAQVPAGEKAIDVFAVTGGGLAQQVAQFVNRLRPRFDHVGFILPHIAMSAGTIWALSGDEIWMDERASLGPIDPQVPGRGGRFLPAQALLSLIDEMRKRGEDRIKQGLPPAWTDLQLLRNLDAKEIGDAYTSSQYSIQLAANYLENYKFKSWVTHQNGNPVSQAERRDRALLVAQKLCDHSQWKAHSHGINREVAWTDLKLKIGHPETVPGFQRSLRRLWALLYWVFDNALVAKMFISQQYSLFRTMQAPGGTK